MPGRRRARRIAFDPGTLCFKPCGRQGRHLETRMLGRDELEALRLIDLEGLYQAEAAAHMGVSRTTLARILTRARRTVTAALIGGERLVLDTDAAAAGPDPDHAIQSP